MSAAPRRAPFALLGVVVAWVCFVTGLALVCGILPTSAPRPATIVAGVLLLLIGINRFLILRWKSKQRPQRWVDRER